MGMPRGVARASSGAVLTRSGAGICLAMVLLLAGGGKVEGADLTSEAEAAAYTYLNLEGGYIHLEGEKAQGYFVSPDSEGPSFRKRSLGISDGVYGRAEIGRVADMGVLSGVGAYVQGWAGNQDNVSETDVRFALPYQHKGESSTFLVTCDSPCLTGEADLDRSLIEFGLRFFRAYDGVVDRDGLSAGIEPFLAIVDEETNSAISAPGIPVLFRSSELDAAAFGALLAVDGRHEVLENIAIIGRVAAGAYYMSADANTAYAQVLEPPFVDRDDRLSSHYIGFRGQLAAGIERRLSDTVSLGAIGRLDYWSDFPSMEWTSTDDSDNAIASKDFLALSIGARFSVEFR